MELQAVYLNGTAMKDTIRASLVVNRYSDTADHKMGHLLAFGWTCWRHLCMLDQFNQIVEKKAVTGC